MKEEQLIQSFRYCASQGVKRFGIHMMLMSNCLKIVDIKETAETIFNLAVKVYHETQIKVEFVDIGGGIGIAYKPEEEGLEIAAVSEAVKTAYGEIIHNSEIAELRVVMECGRVVTGPFGCLVTQIIHQKNTFKKYLGVDASIANLIRPAMYGAYHHMTLLKANVQEEANSLELPSKRDIFALEDERSAEYDVVGSLCENNDRLAWNRPLTAGSDGQGPRIGDYIVIHDAGAHGYAMGFNYNGRMKCAEYLVESSTGGGGGNWRLIRRAETLKDLFSTLPLPQPCAQSAFTGAMLGGGRATVIKKKLSDLSSEKTKRPGEGSYKEKTFGLLKNHFPVFGAAVALFGFGMCAGLALRKQ
eukprot:Platyproteum_vivax@DN259_c0_g1_i1.p1